MQSLLFRLGSREFLPLWLLLIAGSAFILIRFVVRYRDAGKWWLRINTGLFVAVVLPALLVGVSDLFGRIFDWIGFPAPLVWLFGMAGGELVTYGGYLLGVISVLLALGTVVNKQASRDAKIAAVLASAISCLFISLYLYIASRPQHWCA
jgi:hypothetical protein